MIEELDTNDTPQNLDAPGDPLAPDDVFGAAFDDAVALADGAAPAKTEQVADLAKTEPAATEPAATEPAATEPVADLAKTEPAAAEPAAAEPVVADPAKTEPVVADPAKLDPRYLAQALDEAEQLRTKRAQPEPEAQADKLYSSDDFLSDVDKAAIKKLQDDWPEEYVAFDKLSAARAEAAATNAVNTLIKQLNPVLAPLFQAIGTVEVNNHRSAIIAAHSDFDQVLPAVAEWVGQQPSVLKGHFQRVLDKGTTQEIIELMDLYKKEAKAPTGAAPATPASSAAQEPKPAAPAKTPVNPAAVTALAAVPAAQRTPPVNKDASDFDAAFAEAEKALANS